MIFKVYIAFFILFSLFNFGYATLWTTIKASTANISDFISLVETNSLTGFINIDKINAFIPTNDAFKLRYPAGVTTLDAATQTQIVKSHLAILKKGGIETLAPTTIFDDAGIIKYGTEGIGIGKFVKLSCYEPRVSMYMVRKMNSSTSKYDYFINNAELVPPDVDKTGGTGMYHIVNEVIAPIPKNDVMFNVLKTDNRFSDFKALLDLFKRGNAQWDKLDDYFKQGDEVSTFFVPTNAALQPATDELNKVKANATKLAYFLMSHVAPVQVIFSSWMKYTSTVNIQMMLTQKGFATSPLNSTMYYHENSKKIYVACGGVTAQVEGDTQPVKNGLMIAINQPLNLLYRNVRVILQSKASAFLTACDANAVCKNYIDGVTSTEFTVFAPSSFPSTYTNLPAAELNAVLMLHILPNMRLTLATMPASTVVYDSANSTGKLRFNQSTTENWAYGRLKSLVMNHYSQGYVGGRISEADIAGTNGVVQLLNRPLGYPTESIQKILNDRFSQFSQLVNYLRTFDINLDTLNAQRQHYTFFAPTNDAITAMSATSTGQQILANTNDRNALLKRLLVLNTVLLTNLTVNQKYDLTTALPFYDDANQRVTVRLQMTTNSAKALEGSLNIGASNVFALIKPYESEWGATNGIVYALKSIPFGTTTVGRVCKHNAVCSSNIIPVSWTISLLIFVIGQAILRTF